MWEIEFKSKIYYTFLSKLKKIVIYQKILCLWIYKLEILKIFLVLIVFLFMMVKS